MNVEGKPTMSFINFPFRDVVGDVKLRKFRIRREKKNNNNDSEKDNDIDVTKKAISVVLVANPGIETYRSKITAN